MIVYHLKLLNRHCLIDSMGQVCRHFMLLTFLILAFNFNISGQTRRTINLNANWKSTMHQSNQTAFEGFERMTYSTKNWQQVQIPHNWDRYEGYIRKLHNNAHGYAWYRKSFSVRQEKIGKRFFLYFQGVGSYATVWLNGQLIGKHAGGRTTFTLDVTKAIKSNGESNLLALRADHPPHIQDLPWVDGGCSTERGFSEGSQPFGIFRPVQLVVTNEVRIQPFGVHIWNDQKVSKQAAQLNYATTIKNYSSRSKKITLTTQLIDKQGKILNKVSRSFNLQAGSETELKQMASLTGPINLWSLENPYLYKVKSILQVNGKFTDEINTPYGIRWISWPVGETKNSNQFMLNGKPVFINGIAEYEHLLGKSHAFTDEQIKSRVMQIRAAGFNAFRDAHQPHHLLYQDYWDKLGILSWTQMAAHIWFDTPAFRTNFKKLLVEWVKERRNSPSVVLWGLENESTLPEDFAKECTELIRSLDPTASSQRKVTTCNGGAGTDWDVPQNWTGTYGGDPNTYADDLRKQVLVGEYGAWRTLDLHDVEKQGKGFSENKMSALMETKIKLAESVKNEVAGHYFWLYSSHDNPGRVQGGEGLRDLDRVGPVNYKGMFTPWEEPTDVFYLFRSNYADKHQSPMVYIVSHTWPNRWEKPGIKDSVVVYSNCDEVELFNDLNQQSLGKRKRNGIGTHFQWNNIDVKFNLLRAVGYVNGKAVANDQIILQNLPEAPHLKKLYPNESLEKPAEGYHYLYRYNCGGPEITDQYGAKWSADRSLSGPDRFGSISWTKDFPGIPDFFASQRRTFDPIQGTKNWKLFQKFRFGREDLKFYFPLPNGDYRVELYFIEPWLGTGGGMDARGMRIFDVAFNGKVVIDDLDIWNEAGHDVLLKKTINCQVKDGKLLISFPEVKAGQALISAIAISSKDPHKKLAKASGGIVESSTVKVNNWLDIGDLQYSFSKISFTQLPPNLFGAEWLQLSSDSNRKAKIKLAKTADVFIAPSGTNKSGITDFEDTKTAIRNSEGQEFQVFRKRLDAGAELTLADNIHFVALLPPSQMEPAYDLKSLTSYKANLASFKGSVSSSNFLTKERAYFNGQGPGNLQFNIQVGVADVYSLTLKYHNPQTVDQTVKLEFFTASGTLMKSENLLLNPTKEGKWNYVNTNTGTMVNAGAYLVRITAADQQVFYVDALDVQ